ncbi:phosphodiesterase [bacterium BMS3Abin07]|nr:phosphodiesterase [bacterium BMS3Abin07]GBE31783.1 phosphodiesterase [bacterium BMS3Bbin05]HDO22333.1 metallophosphoesterase [Nitrospirota bacterium]
MIGVISDTHDNMDNIRKSVEIFNKKGVSLVVHAGDFTSPFSLVPYSKLKAEFVGIFGNNDGDLLLLNDRSGGRIHKQPYHFEFRKKKIVVMHEHYLTEALADSGHYDIIIFGHTHKALVKKKNNTLIVNPGEAGHWLYGKATVGVIDTDKMDAEIIALS